MLLSCYHLSYIVRSTQIVRAFKEAWPSVFLLLEPQTSTTSTLPSDASTLAHPMTVSFDAISSSFQPIYGPFPYHWVDPLYKPKVDRWLLPPSKYPSSLSCYPITLPLLFLSHNAQLQSHSLLFLFLFLLFAHAVAVPSRMDASVVALPYPFVSNACRSHGCVPSVCHTPL